MLTHLPLDKMTAILANNIFKCIFLNEKDKILIQISLKLVPRGPVDNKPTLVQPVWLQTITWTNDGTVHWRIYAAPGGNELTHYKTDNVTQTKHSTATSCAYFMGDIICLQQNPRHEWGIAQHLDIMVSIMEYVW